MRLAQSKVHFIGIGGVGMCGLAEVLHNLGAQVSGSDLVANRNSAHLAQIGISVQVGHSARNVAGADVVVFSSAVRSDNVEYVEARRLRIPLIPRAEVLAEIMRVRRGIAVGGTHGKTTTTSMVASILIQAELEPTIVVGGRLERIGSTAQLGTGEWLVAEADESDGSFSKLSPEIAVITNIDNDHLDHYGSMENVERAFLDFAGRIPFYGVAVVCGDDPRIRKVFGSFTKRILYYGFDSQNDYTLRALDGGYEVHHRGRILGRLRLPIPGRHNALNALAAIVVGLEVGVSFPVGLQALAGFQGVDRRFHYRGTTGGAPVYDDYGHHPTEVRAVLQAFREKYPQKRLRVLFQPHRYTRTRDCWDEFLECFHVADQLYVYPVYAAGEAPISGVDSRQLRQAIRGTETYLVEDREAFLRDFAASLSSGDVVVALGAGDIYRDAIHLAEMASPEKVAPAAP